MNSILIETEDKITKITLNRPHKGNSLTPDILTRLIKAAQNADQDPGIRVIIITGVGEKAFSSGFDVAEIKSPGGAKPGAERDIVERSLQELQAIRIPVIAMINGITMGAACDLITVCDFRIAVEDARFAIPPVKLGLLYSWQGMQRFINLVGLANAKELFMTGKTISAKRALEIGLVHKIVSRAQLWSETLSLAKELTEGAPLSVTGSKVVLNLLAQTKSIDREILDKIIREHEIVWSSEDIKEGTKAFIEKRKPVFQGR